MRPSFSTARVAGLILTLFIGALTAFYSESGLAGPDAFSTPELQKSRYLNDCQAKATDLTPEMPPTDFQENAPWCGIIGAKALLEHWMHVNIPGDHYEQRFSAMDLSSLKSGQTGPTGTTGRPNLNGSENPDLVLEGAQTSGALYAEADFPMDQAYFASGKLAEQLTNFYAAEKPGNACFLGPRDFSGLQRQFQALVPILRSTTDETSFLNTVATRYGLFPHPKAGAKRIPLKPFSIRDFYASTGDQFMDEVRTNLTAGRPMEISVCASRLVHLPGMDPSWIAGELQPGDCGAHGVDIVGMRNQNGACQLEIRNDWGPNWPKPGANSLAWIPAAQLLSILDAPQGMAEVDSIGLGSATNNAIVSSGSFTYVGQTQNGTAHGTGKLVNANGAVLTGTFQADQLVNGIYKGVYSPTDPAYYQYNGPFKSGMPEPGGGGAFYDKNGNFTATP
jgi:hypothetical protein